MAKDNSNAAEIAELETLPMGELRKRAAKLYGVKVTTDMLKVDIIRAIRNVLNKSDVAKLSKASEDGSLEPGWASITLHYVHGESRHPLMASVNGYMCKIPKDVRVDVPIKVMKSLKDCKKTVLFEDLEEAENSRNRFRWIEADAFPMTVHEVKEGPDPREGHEVLKERKLAPYRAYFEKFGRWPTPRELNRVVMNGKLDGFSSLDIDTPETEAA